MNARKQLLNELTDLNFRSMWQSSDSEGRTFNLFLRNHSSEVGSPFGMVLIMDYPENEGFEVFTTVADTNRLEDDLNVLKERYEGDKLKLYRVVIGNDYDSAELFTLSDFQDYKFSNGQLSQVRKLKAGKAVKLFDFNEDWEIKRIH